MNRRTARNTRRTPQPQPPVPRRAAPRRPRRPWRTRLAGWRDHHLYGFFSSLGRLAARRGATLLTACVLGFALALPLLFFLLFDNARALTGGLREAREITAFLRPELDAPAVSAFADALRRRDDVAAVLTRTPEQGLEEFRQLSGFGAALDALQANPLPSVLVVTPRVADDADDPPLVAELRTDPHVDLVQYDAAWRRRLSSILHFGERLVAVVAALLALATLFVVGNTVRMDIQFRSEEISVMQLVGASDAFVRRPFLYTGLWYGLFGGLVALAIVAGVELALAAPLDRLLASYGGRYALQGLGVTASIAVLAASAALGWFGALVATARHLAVGRPRE
ncbi:MAG TPA: permease-like cell division protein FtsX [Dokdonella sp.]